LWGGGCWWGGGGCWWWGGGGGGVGGGVGEVGNGGVVVMVLVVVLVVVSLVMMMIMAACKVTSVRLLCTACRKMYALTFTFYAVKCVKIGDALERVQEERKILHKIYRRMANWIGLILRRNCFLTHDIGEKIERRV
jgi:hypothetical protein